MSVFKRVINGQETRNYYFWVRGQAGKRELRSAGTPDKGLAQKAERLARKAAEAGRWDALAETRHRSPVGPTVGEVLRRYLNVRGIQPRTVLNNASSLRLVLREATGRECVDDIRVGDLGHELVTRFQRGRLAAAGGDAAEEQRIARSINSTLRQARAVFSRSAMDQGVYDDLKLPDLSGFTKGRYLRQAAAPRFEPIGAEAVARMDAAAAGQLKAEDPAAYAGYLLMRRCGLRNCEAVAARVNWIEERDGRFHLAIVPRPEEGFTPKGNARRVPVSAEVVAELRALIGDWKHLVPDVTETGRRLAVYRRLAGWVRTYVGERQKAAYELRKLAISEVVTREKNLYAGQRFAGHADPRTTHAHYAELLDDLAPL